LCHHIFQLPSFPIESPVLDTTIQNIVLLINTSIVTSIHLHLHIHLTMINFKQISNPRQKRRRIRSSNNYYAFAFLLLLSLDTFITGVNCLQPSQHHNNNNNNGHHHGSGPLTPPSSSASSPIPQQQYQQQQQQLPPIDPIHQQSVEERLASWREQQQFKYENQSLLDQANPRDDEGRMKLLASVSKGSISLFFFILMWRAVHHYELADLSFKGTTRLIMVFPPIMLFLGNMIGCVVSVMSSSSNASKGSKKRLKALLNFNKLVELALIIYNVSRLLFIPSKYILREIYIGRTLSNFLFIVQCQLFTKVTWGAAQISPGMIGSTGTTTTPEQSLDEPERYYENSNDAYAYQGEVGTPSSSSTPRQSYGVNSNNDSGNGYNMNTDYRDDQGRDDRW